MDAELPDQSSVLLQAPKGETVGGFTGNEAGTAMSMSCAFLVLQLNYFLCCYSFTVHVVFFTFPEMSYFFGFQSREKIILRNLTTVIP